MREKYLPYLEHFSSTSPIRGLAASKPGDNVIGLRHDVDYSIDIALKMAWIEFEHDIRSTYYILHTANYMSDEDVFKKCRQIQDFGHEIGLHTNFLAEWYLHQGASPGIALERILTKFRDNDLSITGLAAHGDPACYSGQFTNYWLFKDLKPALPYTAEKQILAEGVKAPSSRTRVINYPENTDKLTRADGQVFPFWSLKLSDYGLDYEASRILQDTYYSDSGGHWLTADPLKAALSTGRHQVLMHPWHWRGDQKHIYFMGTARSGTKWLTRLLSQAASVEAEHEVTLNLHDKNALGNDKSTNNRLVEMLADREETQGLIAHARERSERFPQDYAEANIYLPLVINQLPHGLDTSFVHISRDPKDVVRSLLQRGWYDVPFDPRHPVMAVKDWHTLSQLEQICWYVRSTHEALLHQRDATLKFEKMVSDQLYLTNMLSALEIGLYPDLIGDAFDKRENMTQIWDVPAYEDWSVKDRATYKKILGPLCHRLGYPLEDGDVDYSLPPQEEHKVAPPVSLARSDMASGPEGLSFTSVKYEESVYEFAAGRPAYILLGGGFWKRQNMSLRDMSNGEVDWPLKQIWPSLGGWAVKPIHIYTLRVSAEHISDRVRVICISHDENGDIVQQSDLGVLSPNSPELLLHFKPGRRAKRFNIALFVTGSKDPLYLKGALFEIAAQKEDRRFSLSPLQTLESVKWAPASIVTYLPIFSVESEADIGLWNARVRPEPYGCSVQALDKEKASLFIYSGCSWRDANRLAYPLECAVFPQDLDRILAFCPAVKLDQPEDFISVFILRYNKAGRLAQTIRLGNLSQFQNQMPFSFDISRLAGSQWTIGLHAAPGVSGFHVQYAS